MGRTRQASSTLVLLGSIQLIQSVPTPTLQPLILIPSMVSPSQPATPFSLTPLTVPSASALNVQASATMAFASPPSPPSSTSSPSVTLLPSPLTLKPNEWTTSRDFTLDDFGIQRWNWGKEDNVKVLPALPVPSARQSTGRETSNDGNVIQVRYPGGSINPANANAPQGGMGFYASPLNISHATNVTLSYSVFFPKDFEFVKGGKLPGLYGGKTGCSGGANSDNCFSTRLMFREHGLGELYLYAPKDKQGPGVCKTAPVSYCNSEYGYSIGRGAWTFIPGTWTDVRQDIWLNTHGLPNGGFNVWVNGKLVITGHDAYYRNEDGPTRDQPNLANLPALATPISAPIALAPSAVDSVESEVGNILPALPTGILDGLIVRRHNTHPRGKIASDHITSGRLRARDAFNSSYHEGLFKPSNDTSPIVSSRNLGPFPGLGYPSGYATLSANPIQDTSGAALTYFLSSPRGLTQSVAAVVPTPVPQIGYPNNQSSTSNLLGGLLGLNLRVTTKNHVVPLPASFIGIMCETFFGGHDPSWASPREQYSYFNSFRLVVTASGNRNTS